MWDLTRCPRRFSGTPDEDVYDFMEDLELYIEVKRFPLESALEELGLVLKGDAFRWWIKVYRSIQTWEEAKAELFNRYGGNRRSLLRLFSELRERRQQPNERAIDYIIDIMDIMRKMKPALHDSHQVDIIISGLKPAIARRMIGKDKFDLANLTSEIIQVERSL